MVFHAPELSTIVCLLCAAGKRVMQALGEVGGSEGEHGVAEQYSEKQQCLGAARCHSAAHSLVDTISSTAWPPGPMLLLDATRVLSWLFSPF
jgi:hypothetical protein